MSQKKTTISEPLNTSRIPSKIAIELLAQEKKEKKTSKIPLEKITNHKISKTIQTFFQRILAHINSLFMQGQFYVLLIVFALVWHPGLNNNIIPEESKELENPKEEIKLRSQIHPAQTVQLKISLKNRLLRLYIKDKNVQTLPFECTNIPKGDYKIVLLSKQGKNTVVCFKKSDKKKIFIIMKKRDRRRYRYPAMEFDEDIWDILLPYLRKEIPAKIKE